MALGDQADFVRRLRAVLPGRWFPAIAPLLGGLLNGLAAAWAAIYAQIAYVTLQARVATATGAWLDGISQDFNAGTLPRLINETDAAFSARIRANFFAPKATRAGVIGAVVALTGRTPIIFEPTNAGDSGGYGSGSPSPHQAPGGGLGYGVAGGYGSLALPFSYFIRCYRPHTGGIAGVNGYGGYLGGYGVGAIEYGSFAQVQGQVTDAAIQAAVAGATAEGVTAWMNVSN